MSETVSNQNKIVFVVVRHGERLDYVQRDAGHNWVRDHQQERPFDPPLTDHGKEQAERLGRHLQQELAQLNLPPVHAIYTSPFWRCRQTAAGLRTGLQSQQHTTSIGVEYGLAESINEQWYRSWALPGADGTWGYKINGSKHYETSQLHPLATRPIQELLNDCWKDDTSIDPLYTSKTKIETQYSFFPLCLETRHEQRQRMTQVLQLLGEPNKTIVVVSHGGPVTHLFEELTGQPWYVHGESTYCCYSIYTRATNDDSAEWQALRVNESSYLHEALKGDAYVTDTSL